MIANGDAANLLEYPMAAQAVIATDDQPTVWADYLSTEIPDITARDLLPTAKLVIKDWERGGSRGKIGLPSYAAAVARLHQGRIDAYVSMHSPLDPQYNITDSLEYKTWQEAARGAVEAGA